MMHLKRNHITAEIKRSITFTKKNGKVYKYDSNYRHAKFNTKDSWLDSRVIEARSKKEAQEIMVEEIQEAFWRGWIQRGGNI